ncbi:hypothetical protein [Variovorax sp. PvP013]|jgi:hypothetical protein|uniref:hypothetical protein n=1 Tax=Variovorax sp. PvP013 TaxID=3156435 RepID=UPI003D1F5753
MNISLCTLFEGNYHFGVAALANSLVASGYAGTLWVGYRGALPSWIEGSPDFDKATKRLQVTPSFRLQMLLIETDLHFTYYKPTFLRDMLTKHEPQADAVAYIDPDIVVKCDWSAFSGWFSEDSIGLVEDVGSVFPARHPKRLQWAAYFATQGVRQVRPLDRYYNAGFMAISRANLDFLDLWARLCLMVVAYNKSAKQLKSGGASALFHSTDQDAMNFALTASEAPLITSGPEAMDFAYGGFYLSHAIGTAKPWHGRHIQRALGGVPPSPSFKAYFQFAGGPIQAHSPRNLAWQRLCLRVAAAFGRVYRRA